MSCKVRAASVVITLIFVATQSAAQDPATDAMATATAEVRDRDGNILGIVSATDTPSGQALVSISLTGVPEGLRAVHLHEVGDCSGDFASAGGHIANGAAHGVMHEDGPHPGDMPNIAVQQDGTAQIEFFLPAIDVPEHLLDGDGAAFVLHAGMDDYQSQPAGDAGERIACGVFAPR